MNATEGGALLVRRPDVTLERLGAEAILHDRESGRVHVVNGSAARVWELCDGSRGATAVARDLAAAYGLEPADVAGDVAALEARFRALGLLV
jgi:pyrroloquinoline quinone biosynthesis protein D